MLRRATASLSLLALLAALVFSGCSEEALGDVLAGSLLLVIIGGIILFALVVLALLDLYKGNYPITQKVVWLVIILVVPYIGAILYFLVGRNRSVKV